MAEIKTKDPVYEKIIGQLSKRVTTKGRSLKLTPEIWGKYIIALSFGATYEQAANSSGLTEKMRQDYMTKSDIFRGESERAKNNVALRSRLNIGESIIGKAEREETYVDENGQTKTRRLKAVPGDIENSKWWLTTIERVQKTDDPEDNPIGLGVPKTTEEAELQARMLNLYDELRTNRIATRPKGGSSGGDTKQK